MKIKKKIHIISIISAIIVILIIIITSASGNSKEEIIVVEKRDLTETVRISGTVKADTVAELGFEAAGTVKNVYSKVNDKVRAGQSIATLNLGTLPADLKSAEAEIIIKNTEIDNQSLNLDSIKKQQDTLVKNAYEELLSEDLVAEPSNDTYDQTPPIVTGRYSGAEGRYTIDISSGYSSYVHLIRTFDLEKTEPIDINKTGPTRLGTRGLFIDFPDNLSDYDDTIWYLDIPNIKSSTYSARLSNYKATLNESVRAIEDAEKNSRSKIGGSSIEKAELIKAQASVERIRAQIADRTLIAPFSGVITRIDIDPGEIISANQSVVSIISEGKLGIDIDLPEIDSIKVMIGNKVDIKLDAFKDRKFKGTVTSINRSETIVDGVSVYEARIIFDETIKNIFSGMTADVTIITNNRESVLALPIRAVDIRKDGTQFVKRLNTESSDVEEVNITTGLESTDGYIEILEGVTEKDKILIDEK